MVDPMVIGPATLAMTQAFTAFNSMLPPLSEVRKKSLNDVEFAADVRLGEVAAAGLTLGVGAIASSLTGSTTPVVISAVMAFGLVLMYETTLRKERPMENA